ncbi:disease resistance protein TAO1-like isoform X8 [Carya illinoinensis]|uniref:disease resistance protein TAO1-like isoform X8 n=1 Tax=Carya illinoinensis TaxID=32201 RepID=UPI001C728CB6|nr:disease resistance protein TAO1-like isoform X8 [Carya illinoinensis]
MATQRPSSSTNSENTKKRKRDNSSCSEENETSSLPSSSTARWKHDVFLSFCGEDTRRSFTDHLYSYLKGKGILVFRDDESLERGTYISQELMQAIQESRYAIVIFSKNYAFSKWCLRELAEIVEWEEKKNLTIIPIFYHVDPSHVRKQRGTFAEAFAAHEKDPMVDIEESNTWRNAFTKVGYIKGEHINGDRYESTIIQQISEMILYNYTMPNILIHENQKIVGIDSRVGEILTLLHMESNDVRFLGIHGMGGVGKTTLAEIIYYRFYCQFKGSGFISCTRERSTTAPDLASLQKKLLSKIMQQEIHVWDHRDGLMLMSTRLRNKKVLIILDDVDCEKQLTALAGDHNWFGPGSRVIMTCRDSHLLERNKVNRYKVEPLHTTDALELFSLSAFDETHPPEDYKDLSMDFVNYAGGLPLALKVLGCFLFGRTIDFWKGARDNLKANPKPEIFDILKISFDGLEEPQKILFLDLACFSDRWIDFKKIYSADVIQVLIDKSLVSKDDVYFKERLTMHDLLKEMGRQIVRRECRQEPGRRSRLFHREDVVHVLNNDTGTDAIEGMALSCDSILGTNRTDITNAEAFSKMINLRLLYICAFGYIKGSGNPLEYMPSDKLQFLKWYGYPLKSWPRSFQPKNLIVLNMSDSCIEQLWTGSLVLPNLKELDLSSCVNLIEIPDLSGAPNLEIIKFVYCRSLCKVHPSIKVLKQLQESRMSHTRIKQLWKGLVVLPNLKELDLNSCENLIEIPDLSGAPNLEKINFSYCRSLCKQLWKGLVVLPNLKQLYLNFCENLIEIPDLSGAPNIEEIDFSYCRSLCKVHPSIKVLKQLQKLKMSCTRIKQLWKGLVVLPNLKQLYVDFCENLIEIPDLSGAPNLEIIEFLYCRSLCKVHPSIKVLKQLQELRMSYTQIKQLWKGLVVLPNLKELDLNSCENLIEIPDLSGAPNLEKINFSGCISLCKQLWKGLVVLPNLKELNLNFCENLIEIPYLSGAPNLEKIEFSDCRSLCKQLWKGLDNLKELDLNSCENLIEISDLSEAPNLEIIDFSYCRNLCKVHPSIKVLKQLQELIMSHTRIKQLWKGLVGLDNLKKLDLRFSKNLIEIPNLSGAPNIEEIDFSYCRSLCKVHPSIKVLKQLQKLRMSGTRIKQLWKGLVVLPNLKELDLRFSKNLIKIPNLSGAPNLEKIDFSGCRSLCKFYPSIKVLQRQQELRMSGTRIKQLWKGLVGLDNLKYLNLSGCKNLIEIPYLSGAPNLEIINFSDCRSLCKVHPSIKKLKRLEELNMSGTRIKQLWKGSMVLPNLKVLDLSYCENLIEIPNLSGVPNLMKINFLGCRSLCKFCPSIKVPERLKILGLNKCLTRLLILDKFCLPSSFMSFSGLRELYLGGCNNISIFPSVICSLASLESLHLVGWSRLEKFPDLSRLECLKEFEAYGTAITQMPPVNLIPKNIRSLKIQRRKRMPRKSRDHLAMFINDCFLPKQSSYPTNHDIGSPVEYDMEEMQIYFGIAPFIEGWSLGSRIPEWVHNKSIGSSLQIELDGNTTSVIDCAIFIVFDCHQFHSPEATSIPRLFKETSHVTCSFCCERDDGSLEHFDSGFSLSLVEPSVCWAYARTPLKSNSSDNQSFIKISIKEISSQTPVEVKEWGLHLVCPDDTGLGLGSDLDFYRQFYSAWKCGMTRNED